MKICIMQISDYEEVFNLWKSTPGMELNSLDDTREGMFFGKKWDLKSEMIWFIEIKQ